MIYDYLTMKISKRHMETETAQNRHGFDARQRRRSVQIRFVQFDDLIKLDRD